MALSGMTTWEAISHRVMAGLDPAIHVFDAPSKEGVGARSGPRMTIVEALRKTLLVIARSVSDEAIQFSVCRESQTGLLRLSLSSGRALARTRWLAMTMRRL